MSLKIEAAKDFLTFVNASPSPFHAVHEAKERLLKAQFVEIKEKEPWDISPNGRYFFTRNSSTIVAFAVGGKFKPGNGFSVVGAHTDSPCLKVKPNSKLVKSKFLSVGVETYGGGIWHSWFDRDLSVAGRVLVRKDGVIRQNIIKIDKPLLRVPTLAIHLERTVNKDGFKFNVETQLVPVLTQQLNGESKDDQPEEKPTVSQVGKHHPAFLSLISEECSCKPEDIVDFELCLFDTQPSVLGGLNEEFIFSPRLDNLMSSFCGLQGLIKSLDNDSLESDPNVRMLALFDHEEVGSDSAQGAGSSLFEHVLRRLSSSEDKACGYEESVPKSMIVSADMAHALHPNYSDKHESNHKPEMNKGPVIKFNSNQRYATNAITATILREVAVQADVPLQDVMVRNDSPCGSTIGPIMASNLGMRTIDIGNAQLSMHSCREMGGSGDVEHAVNLFQAFYEKFPSVDATLQVE